MVKMAIAAGALAAGSAGNVSNGWAASGEHTSLSPANPFYAESRLPFHAPPFNLIHDEDYQPALEAGMAEQLREMDAIASDPAAPTFDNTFAAMERTGALLDRVQRAFSGVTGPTPTRNFRRCSARKRQSSPPMPTQST